MQLFVKLIDGKTATFKVELNNTIYDIKQMIEDKTGIPPKQQRLIYHGISLLKIDNTLADYDIPKDSTFHLVLRLYGCSCCKK